VKDDRVIAVEERMQFLDAVEGLLYIGAFADGLHVRLLGEEVADSLSRQGLVIHDERSYRHRFPFWKDFGPRRARSQILL